ncbi:MAG: hypothetical protein AABY75_05690 [Bacteroidota bacterium]
MADSRVRIEKPLECADLAVRVLSSHAHPETQKKAQELLNASLDQLLAPAKPVKEA